MPTKIAIGCSSYLLGEALKKILEDDPEMMVIGIFTEKEDLTEALKLNPQVLIINSTLFQANDEEILIAEGLKILILDVGNLGDLDERQMTDLIEKGLVGIIPPGEEISILKKALKAISSGELWFDRKTLSSLLTNNHAPSQPTVHFTKAEEKVMSLLCRGFRNKEIAQELQVSEQTVKSHCNRIFKKTGLTDRLQLAIYAYKLRPEWGRQIPSVKSSEIPNEEARARNERPARKVL
jgi:DNA-binding NarL/FixJ family response regulator